MNTNTWLRKVSSRTVSIDGVSRTTTYLRADGDGATLEVEMSSGRFYAFDVAADGTEDDLRSLVAEVKRVVG